MIDPEIVEYMDSPEFNEKCRALNARMNAGEPMTVQHMADAVGLPYQVFFMCMQAATFMSSGIVMVDDGTPQKKPN